MNREIEQWRVAVAVAPAGARWSPWLVLAGLTIIGVYVLVGFGLASVAGSYFAVSKADRDLAQAGSAILAQLQYLQATGAWLEPLKFTGLSLIIGGIAASLSAIIQTLRTRAAIMHAAFTMAKGAQR